MNPLAYNCLLRGLGPLLYLGELSGSCKYGIDIYVECICRVMGIKDH